MNTKMPVGMSDFKTVRETCYMVDKTDFIRRLLDNHKSVTLFTRPRRFGKTLTMSMLDYFFSIDKKDVSAELFKGLAIETQGSSYMSHRGQYPVIFFTLKDFYNTSWESMYRSFRLFMQSVYAKYIYLLDSSRLSAFEKEGIQRVLSLKAEPEEYQISLQRLAALLYKHYQVRPIILIDEYDAPLQRAYEQHFYEEALPFWKGWFNATLKDNEAVYFAVMTGVLRIAKESIFSGLNNLDVFSVLNSQYSDVFGFTNPEITAMARDLGYQDKIGEIKQWYDGYCFGNTEVYNPWSVIQYMDKTGEPQPYWVNTAENNILKELLVHAKPQRVHELQRLVQGASVSATLHDSVIYDELWRNDDALYTMLLTTGYLTVQEKSDEIYNRYALRIPNKEINYVYSTEILNTLIHGMSRNDFDGLFDALVHGKAADFEQRLQRVLLGFVSTFDTAQKESFYHGFMLGITALFGNSQYIVESNQESGYGRFDIALFPKNTTKAGVILEFKVAKTTEEMKQKAEEALSQIDSKQYISSFQKRGIRSVWKYGIAFCGKKVLIKRA